MEKGEMLRIIRLCKNYYSTDEMVIYDYLQKALYTKRCLGFEISFSEAMELVENEQN